MEKRMFVMAHEEARRRAMSAVADAPAGWVVEVKPKTRSLEQNALLHALCGQVAKRKVWMGRRIEGTDWKRLFVDGYLREKHQGGFSVVPSLDGTGVVSVGEPTRSMSKADMTELIEYIQAWCAENGIEVERGEAEVAPW